MGWLLLLEIYDPPVVEIVTQLRRALSKKSFKPNVHVTVRGPVEEAPDTVDMKDVVVGESIFLAGVGVFHNVDASYVYLTANGRVIDQLWSKRDYPKSEFGVNAHVTLFETSSKESADKVCRFLKFERLEFHCRDLKLRWHKLGQQDLFSDEAYQAFVKGRKDYRFDISSPRVSSTLLPRATLLGAALSGNES
jgi:hypothetical protein